MLWPEASPTPLLVHQRKYVLCYNLDSHLIIIRYHPHTATHIHSDFSPRPWALPQELTPWRERTTSQRKWEEEGFLQKWISEGMWEELVGKRRKVNGAQGCRGWRQPERGTHPSKQKELKAAVNQEGSEKHSIDRTKELKKRDLGRDQIMYQHNVEDKETGNQKRTE